VYVLPDTVLGIPKYLAVAEMLYAYPGDSSDDTVIVAVVALVYEILVTLVDVVVLYTERVTVLPTGATVYCAKILFPRFVSENEVIVGRAFVICTD
jgi:hypothetical protein